ncbi:MAG: VanZ family protein [Balneolaceae bacterium]|nr:VanZ family protein [Balneolaceae bacterium]
MIQNVLRYLTRNPRALLWTWALITTAALLLTLFPADYVTQSKLWTYDKLGHLILFGSWTFLLGLYQQVRQPGNPKLLYIFLLGVLFGGLIEILQYLLPVNRHADLFDFGFDVTGALGAILLLKILPFPTGD